MILFDVSGAISRLGRAISPYLVPILAYCILTAPVSIYFFSKIIMQLLFLRKFKKLLFYIGIFALFVGLHYIDKMYKFHNGGYVDVATYEFNGKREILKSDFTNYKVIKEPRKLFAYIIQK